MSGFESPEKTRLVFGYIPLTDCAPLVVAREKGLFDKYGLEVSLQKEASWANIRDKVYTGALDGAQMLAAMPIATSLSISAVSKPTITAFSMDLNGNAITISNALHQRLQDIDPESAFQHPRTAAGIRKLIDSDRHAGNRPLTFAVVYPFSMHNYELRYWLAASGINPDRDVRIIVIPPQQMVSSLAANHIDGFCVGEPWNQYAISKGIGHAVITGYEIWQNSPEKVFGVNLEWAERYPGTHQAVLMALIEAAQWADLPENRREVAEILSRCCIVEATVDEIAMSMTGTYQYEPGDTPVAMPDFNVFYRYSATFPWRSHAEWQITQMYRWAQISESIDIRKAAAEVYRPDLYREAAAALGVDVPAIDHKQEGVHSTDWTLDDASRPIVMGPDLFCDGRVFDPQDILAYLNGFEIQNSVVTHDSLAKDNG